jgi:ribosomal protein L12E/L44/L45/RPP1/RPP2
MVKKCPGCGKLLDDLSSKADEKPEPKPKDGWSKLQVFGVGVFVIGSVMTGGALAVTAAGFGSAGIVGGSVAAAVQSSIGNVAAGSLFAALQSAGATGTIAAVGSAGGMAAAGGAATAAGATLLKRAGDGDDAKREEEDKEKEERNERNRARKTNPRAGATSTAVASLTYSRRAGPWLGASSGTL